MYFVPPVVAWILAQSIKVLIETLRLGKFNRKRLFGSGGMPSSHAAAAVALTAALWRDFGINHPLVAVTLTFTLIVLHDAAGVRWETGRQAQIINKIIDELMQTKQITNERLKELLGHTPLQVLMGSILGLVVGILL